MMDRARIALAMLCAWVAIIGATVLLIRGPRGLSALVWFLAWPLVGVLILPASVYQPPKGQ